MHRPVRCLQTTSPDVSDIGQDERCLPICSSPVGAIVWMGETSIERSMRCLDGSVREAIRQSGPSSARHATDSRQTLSCSPKWPIWSNLSRARGTQKILIFFSRILYLSHPPRDNRIGDPNGIRTRVTAVKGRCYFPRVYRFPYETSGICFAKN
jgi:hypothetical protein